MSEYIPISIQEDIYLFDLYHDIYILTNNIKVDHFTRYFDKQNLLSGFIRLKLLEI